MRKIAVINQKGGVGKTTSCCNIGAAIASTGKRVLLIDLDPQAHLSMHVGADPFPDRPSIYDVLTDSLPLADATIRLHDTLHLIPSHIDLAAAEMELVSTMGREVILRDALPQIAGQYDVLMMDCPPSLGVLTINGLAAASEVFIPLQPHFLALQGVGKLLETIELVEKRINPKLAVSGIILCMYEAGTRLAAEVTSDLTEFIQAARETNKPWSRADVFKTFIRRNIKLAESPGYGKTIFDYAPSSNGAKDYAALTAEVLGLQHLTVEPTRNAEPPRGARADDKHQRSTGSGDESPPPEHADASTMQDAGVTPLNIAGRIVTGPDDLAANDDSAANSVNDAASPNAANINSAHPNDEESFTTDSARNTGEAVTQSPAPATPAALKGARIPIQFDEATDSEPEAQLG